MLLVEPIKVSVDATKVDVDRDGGQPPSPEFFDALDDRCSRIECAFKPFEGLLVPRNGGRRNVVEVFPLLDEATGANAQNNTVLSSRRL